MKALDVVKVLMGIYSERLNVKRYCNDTKWWSRYQEYDYEDVFKISQQIVNQYYLDAIFGSSNNSVRESIANEEDSALLGQPATKMRKLN
jgi:hypothetical protein